MPVVVGVAMMVLVVTVMMMLLTLVVVLVVAVMMLVIVHAVDWSRGGDRDTCARRWSDHQCIVITQSPTRFRLDTLSCLPPPASGSRSPRRSSSAAGMGFQLTDRHQPGAGTASGSGLDHTTQRRGAAHTHSEARGCPEGATATPPPMIVISMFGLVRFTTSRRGAL